MQKKSEPAMKMVPFSGISFSGTGSRFFIFPSDSASKKKSKSKVGLITG